MAKVNCYRQRFKTVEERFWEKVEKTPGGCWLWTAFLNPTGYGMFGIGSRTDGTRRCVFAHRFAYTLLVGPIPDGLTLDHLCRVHACVKPAHLEPATDRENILRSPIQPAAVNARKTHCHKGHPFAGDNLRITKHGKRQCVECYRKQKRESQRRRRQRMREGGEQAARNAGHWGQSPADLHSEDAGRRGSHSH